MTSGSSDILQNNVSEFYMATPLGFEPRITPPKGAVLPLHHGVCGLAFLDSSALSKIQV
jgi:hypothetical protein